MVEEQRIAEDWLLVPYLIIVEDLVIVEELPEDWVIVRGPRDCWGLGLLLEDLAIAEDLANVADVVTNKDLMFAEERISDCRASWVIAEDELLVKEFLIVENLVVA